MLGHLIHSFAVPRQSGKLDCRNLITVLNVAIALSAVAMSSHVYGQIERGPDVFASDLEDPSVPFPQLPRVEHAVVVGNMAYICWPRSLVGQATITALDLQTLQTKWSRPIDDYDVKLLRLFGDLLYCGVGENAPTRYDGPRPNSYELSFEWLLKIETGELAYERTVDRTRWRHPILGDSYLVTNQIVDSSGQLIAELDFAWYQAKIRQGQLYTIGDSDDVPKSVADLTRIQRRQSADGVFRSSERIDSVSRELKSIHVLRVTDLATGVTQLTVPLPTPFAVSDAEGWLWNLVAATDDRVALQVYQSDLNSTKKGQLICYDFRQAIVVWRQTVPCEIGRVRLIKQSAIDGKTPATTMLECQCRCSPATPHELEHGTFERQPLMIDWATGECRVDKQWSDPASMLAWHIGSDSILHLSQNDRYIVAVLNQAQLLAIDSADGQLLWRHDVADAWPPFSDALDELYVAPTLGGIEITEVATGRTRRIKPEHVELQIVPILQLPKQLAIDQDTVLSDARTDWFYDRPLMMLPVVPLVVWGLYLFLRKPHKVIAKSKADI